MRSLYLLTCCLITSTISAQIHIKPDQHSAQPTQSDQDKELEQWLKENNIPNLGLGIINNGQLEKVKVYREIHGAPAPNNTIFNVASLTKPVTAMIVLKLVSLGKWNLDEPVYKYWTDPDIAKDPRNKKLTTRIILSHQTGFPNWRQLNTDGKLNFQFDPGTKYQYSGEGFEYLRKALEAKFHKTLNELANELIFRPLKMNNTSYIWSKNTDSTRIADGYDKDGKAYKTIQYTTASGADNLLTTIEDYSKFLISVLNGDGLSKQVFKDMETSQVSSKKGKHFGLGFEIYTIDKNTIALSHAGYDEGAQTLFFIFPKTKQGIIIFTNSDNGYKIYEKLLTSYLGDYGRKIVAIEGNQFNY